MEIMEDLEVIEEQSMDVIQELTDLERERDKEANKELEDGYHYGPVRSGSQFIPCSHKTTLLFSDVYASFNNKFLH